jgi:hypothetical protein
MKLHELNFCKERKMSYEADLQNEFWSRDIESWPSFRLALVRKVSQVFIH